MPFHIRERIFSMSDTFDITDDYGNPVYQVRARIFTWGKTLDLFDMSGQQVMEIHQRMLTFMPEYEMKVDGQVVGHVKKHFSFLTPSYEIDGPDGMYTMQGDWLGLNYTISDGVTTLASVSREFALMAQTYGVDVAPGADAPLMLAIAIVMEEVTQSRDSPSDNVVGDLVDLVRDADKDL